MHVCVAQKVIGAVLIPGARAPLLVKKHHLKEMKAGSVIIDVAVDQGGCIEVQSHNLTTKYVFKSV